MTTSPEQPDPELEALQKLAFDTLAELAQIHAGLHPTQDVSVFVKMFAMLRDNPSTSGDQSIAQLERAQDERKPGNYLETALVVSSSYLAESYREVEQQRIGRAWHSLAKACYWCGIMRSVDKKIDLTLQAADALRKAESGIGGRTRADRKYGEAKKVVILLAHELRPFRGWGSRREAALAIEKHLLGLSGDDPSRQAVFETSADRWERTFSDWLGMDVTEEEFRQLFPDAKIPARILNARPGDSTQIPK